MSVSIIDREIKTILERVNLESLRDSRVLITGATGFIGSMLIRALLSSQKDIKVIAMARSREKACQVFGEDIERIDLVLGDITEPIPSCAAADYIIHTASVTASKYMVTNPVETIETAIKGTANVLDFARDCHAKSVVYLSSMEVYGVTSPEQNPVTEEKLGYIDLYNPRSCYSEGKRLCENMCCAYTKEFNVPVKVARLANTFGPGVSKNDNRLF
ncbi:MAG: NAD-dependent epimerase/dehydratase family protein, partial [Clostridiales bacterium]|nr:NAD-dependent epimerase/dehydratase family protein [Clostridiales bacterium]